jgi:hypothetical protein
MNFRKLVIPVLMVFVLAISGCGKGDESTTPTTSNAPTNSKLPNDTKAPGGKKVPRGDN